MKTGNLPTTSKWHRIRALCSRTTLLLAFMFAFMLNAQAQVATGFSTTKGNFETDADYYTNTFQFPDTPCVVPAGAAVADDWIGPALAPAVYGTYPAGPFPVGTGFGRVDSTGAAAFKAAIGCNVPGATAANQTALFPKNFDSLQAYIVPVGAWPNSGDTMVLVDAFAARDHYGLSGSLDQTTFTGMSNKNINDPSTWSMGPGTSGPNKNDLIDVGVALDLAFNAPKYFPTYFSPFDFTAHGFATTLSTNGDSHIDAEIFKLAMTYDPSCFCMINTGPDYGHSAWTLGAPPFDGIVSTANPVVESQGDLLISADYANGGTQATIALRIWLNPLTLPGSSSTNVETRLLAWNAIVDPFKPFNFSLNQGSYSAWNIESGADFGYFEIVPTSTEPFAWARVNSRLVSTAVCPIPSSTNMRALPWGNLAGSGAACNDSTLTLQSLEVTIDDSRLGINLFAGSSGNGGLGCEQQFGSIMYKTRTSTSFTAELKDFAGPFPFIQVKQIGLSAHTENIDCNNPTGAVCVDAATATSVDPLTVTISGPAASAAGPFSPVVDTRVVPPATTPYCVTGLAAGYYSITAAVNPGCDSTLVVQIIDNTDLTPPAITCPPTITINCGDAVPSCLTYAQFIAAGGTASDASGIDIASFQCSTSGLTGGTCGSYTRTYTISDNCGNPNSCTQTIDVVNVPVVFNCPAPSSAGSCSTQAQVDAAFAAWLGGFTSSGGCNRQASYGTPVAPNRCGGSTTVTYSVTSDCEATHTCSSTFSVTNAPAVVYNCPAPANVGSCSTQAQVDAAFAAWLADFTSSGGCDRQASYGTPVAPNRCGGSTSVTYTVTSSCEATRTCSSTFTVANAPAVVYNCPAPSTFAAGQTQAQVDAAFATWLAGFTSSGGCDRNPSYGTPTAPAACGGTTNVTYTVTSSCEATRTCSSSFTVLGCPAIIVNCPAPSTAGSCSTQAQVDAAFAAWLTGFTSSGGCNRQASYGTPVAPNRCGGSTTVTYTVTGDCAATQTCSSTFSVTNAPAVVYNCPAPFTAGSCSTQAQIDAAFATWLGGFTSSGGCDRQASYGTPVAPNRCGGSTTVTYTVTSSCEATRTCAATFTVTNAPAVVYNCPAPFTAGSCSTQAQIDAAFATWLGGFTSSGGCDRQASYGTPVAPNRCGGSTTVTYTVTSSCEATRTCAATFTVTNAPAVVYNCPAPFTAGSCSTQAQIDAAFAAWLTGFTSSGGCDRQASYGTPVAPNRCGGSTTVTYTVTSTCEATRTCAATFTVTNAPAVVYNCPAPFTAGSCSTQAQIDAAFAAWLGGFTSSGGCDRHASYGTPVAPNRCGGSTTVTYTVTSTCEATRTCAATFTVTNAPAVVYNCPAPSTFAAGQTQAQVDAAFATWLAGFTSSGGCDRNPSYGTPTAPAACGGTTNVTYTVTSSCEATRTCSSSFTVLGCPAIIINCPAPFTAGSCSTQAQIDAAFASWLTGFTSSGGCDRQASYGTPVAPNRCGGSTTVTYTVTGTCAATQTCAATFTVTNAPAVVYNCPAPFTAGSCSTQAQIDAAFATWLGGFTSSGGCNRVASYGTPVAPNRCGGSTTVTYTVTSSCEATRTCAATFTVTNAPAVVYNCPGPFTAGSCSTQAQIDAAFATWLGGFTSSGGCDRQASYGTPVAPNRCGGSTTVTYTVTSSCEATRTCAATFTVTNAPAVVYNCPAPFTAGSCSTQAQIDAAFAAWLGGFTSSGGCNRQASYGTPVAPNRCGGSTTVTYTVTSSCEATRTCAATFTVTNAPAVVYNCPAPFTAGSCSTQAQIDAAFATWLGGFTSSGGCNRQASYGTPVAPNRCGGSTTVTYTVTSSCEATRTCAATFTVTNAPAVVYNCPAPFTASACSTQAQVDAAFAAWLTGFTSSGGCDRHASYGTPVAPNRCGGSTTVTYTVTSSCEATRTCASTFTVTTSPAITLTCPANRTVGYCQRTQTWTPGVSGGCSPTTTCVPASGTTFPVGTTTVTCTSSDACNSTSCSFTITVVAAPTCNLIAPTIRPICGSTGNTLCVSATGAGPLTYTWTKISGAGWSITGQSGNCITYTAGSSDSVVFSVVVKDIYNCTTTCTVTYGCRNPYWGCTLGFWKNHTSIWNDATDPISACVAAGITAMGAGYSGNGTSASSFRTTFGLTAAQMTAAGYPSTLTLLQALNLGGGTWGLLARSGVAALLNSCGLSGHFYYNTPQQVLLRVHNAVVAGSASNANVVGNDFQVHNETQPDACPPAGPANPSKNNRSVYGNLLVDDNYYMSAYPNPFNTTATIEFGFAYPTDVTLSLFNVNGEKVADLYNGNVKAGESYQITVDGNNLPAGIYFYRIDAGEIQQYEKIILMK